MATTRNVVYIRPSGSDRVDMVLEMSIAWRFVWSGDNSQTLVRTHAKI